MSKVKILPPKKNKKSSKGVPPLPKEMDSKLENKENNSLVALNFRVSPELRKEFKQCALDRNMTMLDFFKSLFEKREFV